MLQGLQTTAFAEVSALLHHARCQEPDTEHLRHLAPVHRNSMMCMHTATKTWHIPDYLLLMAHICGAPRQRATQSLNIPFPPSLVRMCSNGEGGSQRPAHSSLTGTGNHAHTASSSPVPTQTRVAVHSTCKVHNPMLQLFRLRLRALALCAREIY